MRVTTKWDPTMTHYIGRPSIYGNPFPMNSERDREEKIAQFENWVRNNSEMLRRIRELPENAVLGCYCSPKPCHGDVIVKIWKEMHP
jgi:hypothetical protein